MHVSISQLTIYPVKSMSGLSLQEADLDAMGLRWDRRWMVVDQQGKFITARECPQLLLIQPELGMNGELSLQMPDAQRLVVPPANDAMPALVTQIWDDRVEARHLSNDIDTALSDYLQRSARLVFIEDSSQRQVDLEYARPGDRTGFSDGFPLLLISEASLEDLNRRLDTPLPMKRFRPNLVVSGCPAYAEDHWSSFRCGEVTLKPVKPCSRCIMTTVDPATGQRDGKEPLATLNLYRRVGNKVLFGQNVIHQQTGRLKIGDTLIIEQNP